MKFNDSSNTHDSLVDQVDNILGTTSTEFPLAWKAAAANTWKGRLALQIWKKQDEWDFDDSAHTNLAVATTTLVDGQRDYTLPTTALAIDRVEVKDSSGDYYKLDLIDEEDIQTALTDYGETDGVPGFYWLKKRSIFLDPPPDSSSVTTSAGLRIYYKKEVNEFDASTTTTEIGFGEPFDKAVQYGVAYEYAGAKGMDIQAWLQRQLFGEGRMPGLIRETVSHFADRAEGDRRELRESFE